MKIPRPTKKGFTIVEVMIVLAIASLIIVMVLVAVNAANRSSRDARRKNDAATLATALDQWAQNHSGVLPASGSAITFNAGALNTASPFCTENYLKNSCQDLKDPTTGAQYTFTAGSFAVGAGALPSPCVNGRMRVDYSSSRDYTIDVCEESGSYHFSP